MRSFKTKLTTFLVDPTFLFAAGCLAAAFTVKLDDASYIQNNLLNPVFLATILSYILFEIYPQCISLLVSLFKLLFCCLFIGDSSLAKVGQSPKKNSKNVTNVQGSSKSGFELSYSQSMIARWYLLNGLIFHGLMDGLSGDYNLWPAMHDSYLKLDKRFLEPLKAESLPATLTVHLELIIMFPLCLIVYYGYRCHVSRIVNINNKNVAIYPSWVYGLEIVVSVFQICGNWFMAGAEYTNILFKTGNESIPVDWNLEFSNDSILYFWFSTVIAPYVWIFVPIYMIKRAINDLDISRNVKID